MDYKGFNIAIHELGHNVEQVVSMSLVDHTLLMGVPNTGFTEAFAFLFQARDLELLGQTSPAGSDVEAMRTLDRFWSTYEIAGVAMLDIEIWHWMYDHPEATPAELREAVLELARGVWNRYYAPVFGVRDVVLPAIYSHIVAYGLYTPDYPLGFIITSQVEEYMRSRDLATEMERMCRLGRIAPDVWMELAVGEPVSSRVLLEAAEAAIEAL
jgi:oligoendopeptidase F